MRLIKNNAFQEDIFTPLTNMPDDADTLTLETLPEGAIIVSLTHLKHNADMLRNHGEAVGVLIKSDNQGKTQMSEDVRDIEPYLDMLAMVALEFPTFRNGRGYSSARILRDEMKFTGEIRAVGDVAYDQWGFMVRCGIDAFAIDNDVTLEQFTQAIGKLSDVYQPASDNRTGIPWRR